MVVNYEQRSAADVIAKEQSFAGNEVSAAPLASSDTVTASVTLTLSGGKMIQTSQQTHHRRRLRTPAVVS